MLSRIPVHRFDALSLFRCRASIATANHQSIFCPHMQRQPTEAALGFAVGQGHCRRRRPARGDAEQLWPPPSTFVADANTVAESRTSIGRHLRVSFKFAEPPSSSYLYYDFPESARIAEGHDDCIGVVAANGEFVLLEVHNPRSCSVEHFVYRALGARRPPSLSLLPIPDFPTKSESVPASYFNPPRRPRMDSGGIGLLRRGENDLLVVHVDLCYDRDKGWRKMAVFYVLRPGMRQWELMEPVPIEYGPGSPKNVTCVGDRFLCWVRYGYKFLLCDMADEGSPKVRYVCLPPEASRCNYGNDNPVRVRRMGVAGDSSVRLVSIHPHCCTSVSDDPYCCGTDDDNCCCDDHDRIACWHPRFVFTVKTWTMNLTMDEPLEWVEDREVDAEEIWVLPGYEGLPQAIPEWPVLCLEKPNVVCFLVSNYHFSRDDEKVLMVQLNMKTKRCCQSSSSPITMTTCTGEKTVLYQQKFSTNQRTPGTW